MAVNQEIERKFLTAGEYRPHVVRSYRITQGYLSTRTNHTIRVRLRDDQGFLTIKGRGDRSGISRPEWEIEISSSRFERLLRLCDPLKVLDKTRHIVPVGDHTFEVDEFHGVNEGLTVAEVELSDESEVFLLPQWLGKEVTGDVRYYNSQLSIRPYCMWSSSD